ncbi:MAG: EAL domain-containing protein [Pseudomonadota bacterium]
MDGVSVQTLLAIIIFVCSLVGGFGVSFAAMRARALRQEVRFESIYNSVADGIYRSTLDGRLLSANPAMVQMNGYETEQAFISSVNDMGDEWYIDPRRRDEFVALIARDGRVENFVSEVHRHKTGERIWISENAQLVRPEDRKKAPYYQGTVREVSDQIRRQNAERRLAQLTAIVPGCLYQFRRDADGSYSFPYVSRQMANMFPLVEAEKLQDAEALFETVHPSDIEKMQASIEESAQTLATWSCDFRVKTEEGYHWVHGNSIPELQPDGTVLWSGFLSDISARKQEEERVHDMAFIDSLTKLPNRRYMEDQLDRALLMADRSDRNGAVFFIDLDNFKRLNDTEGHAVGDKLLVEVADRLQAAVRKSDTVARLGGDEFVILVEGLEADIKSAEMRSGLLARRILQSVGEPYDLDGVSFHTTPSIGIAMFEGASHTAPEVLVHADTAMYEAKRAGRNTMRMFDPDMQRNLEQTMSLIDDLREAMTSGDLTLHYQPVVNAEGETIAAEALLRWTHPERGVMNPREFLAIAQQYGLLAELNDWVIEKAIDTLREWEGDEVLRDLRMFVNVSASRFLQSGFTERLGALLMKKPVKHDRLTLEVTEAVMSRNTPYVAEQMRNLNALGVSFCMDDFGTGFTSISQLSALPLAYIKVDPTIVQRSHESEDTRLVVRTVLAMSRALEIPAIAEGVETDEQFKSMKAEGCTLFQGFKFGSAVPIVDLKASQMTARSFSLSA